MYYLFHEKEKGTGFKYCNLTDKITRNKPELEIILVEEFEKQHEAVNAMRACRKEYKKYNLKLDPNYVPLTKRR